MVVKGEEEMVVVKAEVAREAGMAHPDPQLINVTVQLAAAVVEIGKSLRAERGAWFCPCARAQGAGRWYAL